MQNELSTYRCWIYNFMMRVGTQYSNLRPSKIEIMLTNCDVIITKITARLNSSKIYNIIILENTLIPGIILLLWKNSIALSGVLNIRLYTR